MSPDITPTPRAPRQTPTIAPDSLMRASFMRAAVAGLSASESRILLADFPLAELQNMGSRDWVPASWPIGLADRAVRHMGPIRFEEYWLRVNLGFLDMPLLAGALRVAVAAKLVAPKLLLGRGKAFWEAETRGMGSIGFQDVGPNEAHVLYIAVPEVFDTMAGFRDGCAVSLKGLMAKAGARGTVKIIHEPETRTRRYVCRWP